VISFCLFDYITNYRCRFFCIWFLLNFILFEGHLLIWFWCLVWYHLFFFGWFRWFFNIWIAIWLLALIIICVRIIIRDFGFFTFDSLVYLVNCVFSHFESIVNYFDSLIFHFLNYFYLLFHLIRPIIPCSVHNHISFSWKRIRVRLRRLYCVFWGLGKTLRSVLTFFIRLLFIKLIWDNCCIYAFGQGLICCLIRNCLFGIIQILTGIFWFIWLRITCLIASLLYRIGPLGYLITLLSGCLISSLIFAWLIFLHTHLTWTRFRLIFRILLIILLVFLLF